MTRKCDCAGGCGPQPDDGVTRREFLTLVGAGAAGAVLAASPDRAAAEAAELAEWKRALGRPSGAPVYRSDKHTDARMPLGGIGTGNVEIGADGQFTTWQLFNTLRDGYVPFFFGVRVGKTARMLQTVGGPEDLPRIGRIEMTGEYPFATLRFRDPALPVEIDLNAFTPFAPLDTNLSSIPAACLVFRVHNPTKAAQTVSLAGFLQNPVGYDAMGPARSFNSFGFNRVAHEVDAGHPNFGGNVNEVRREGGAAVLLLRAEPGAEPTLDRPVRLYTNANLGGLNALPIDRPADLTVEGLDRLAAAPPAEPAQAVVWLEDAPADFGEAALRAARDAVRAGATLVFSGRTLPLLQAYAGATGGRAPDTAALAPDVLFDDFENGYEKWTVEGEAFGTAPAEGTLPGQQRVAGFAGRRLVNSFRNGDDTTGRLTSRPFTVERGYVRFLVGGGRHATTQIRLVIGGKTVRATSGNDNEQLLPAWWDVREFRGQTARIAIVDEQKGAWGHINVDQIEFGDLPFARPVLELLDELLPARFTGVRAGAAGPALENPALAADARESTVRGGMRVLTRPVGKGKVVLALGSILAANEAELMGARQRAYGLLAELAGARYTASPGVPAKAPGSGTLALATSGPAPTALPAFDDWRAAWETFARTGRFQTPAQAKPNAPTPAGKTVNGVLASTVRVPAGQTVEVPFFLAWHYPNKYNDTGTVWMGNHYATRWPDARAVARALVKDFPILRKKTEQFRATFYDSTLPRWLLDAVSSQVSTIRHVGVVFRIASGDIYGWEGSNGCCQPTCTHVWGYEQTMAYLFPDLERDMRRIDFLHQQREDGGVNNRTDVPSPPRPTGERPFSDGHASSVLKAYREARNHPDGSWLRTYWPRVKNAVEYLIARDAGVHGGQPDGTQEDDQWNTYDCAIHGVNTFISAYYLAALRAGEEMARHMGDPASAKRYHEIFERGQKKLVDVCWNGEYFYQNLPDYAQRPNEYGPGCLADQLIGQWWAHQLGLGYVLPKEHVRTALKSIFKYNWLTDHTNWRHNWRKFAGGKDKGLLICAWPKGGRPAGTILYADEVWTGVEYQVAAHMVYEGMIDEAFMIVKGVRDRYDGVPRAPIPRNPWNEIECGGHYARAMSNWSLLLALAGFEYDGPARTLRFAPSHTPNNFRSFFSGPEGWGSLRQTRSGKTQRNEIKVVAGTVPVRELHLEAAATGQARVTLNGKTLAARTVERAGGRVRVALPDATTVGPGQTLTVVIA